MVIMNDFLISKKEDMRNYLLSIKDKEFTSFGNKIVPIDIINIT